MTVHDANGGGEAASGRTLRSLFLNWSTGFILFSFLTAAALIGTTTRMRTIFEHFERQAKQFDAAARLRTDLYQYSRFVLLRDLTREKRFSDEAAQAKSRIEDLLSAARADPDLEARAALGRSEANISKYFRLRERASSSAHPGEALERTEAELSHIISELGPIVESRDRNRREALARVSRWDRAANIFAVVFATLVILAAIVAIRHFRSMIQTPLLVLHDAIRRYAEGEQSARIPPIRTKEIREVRDTFNAMADRLAREDESRLTFLAGVAHDLRNPLTALTSSIELLSRKLPEDKRQSLISLLAKQATRLDRMVSDFLDTTRIQAGKFELHLETVGVRKLIEETVSLWQSTTTKHRITTRLPSSPLTITCDPLRLEQVINNVINNAIKYSPEGGTIALTVDTTEKGVRISVHDQGIGIPAEDLNRIFEPFRRTSSSIGAYPGVGIGLSTALKIMKAHGGSISVESIVGRGSTFHLWLPAGVRSSSL